MLLAHLVSIHQITQNVVVHNKIGQGVGKVGKLNGGLVVVHWAANQLVQDSIPVSECSCFVLAISSGPGVPERGGG